MYMYGVKNYLFLCSSAILTVGLASHAYASPEGGSVAAGNANITQGTKVTDIHQSSSKAIIDWTSFDVAGDEAVNFHQPDSGSITLNRIHDHKASQIDGSITANGHVMLLNQNGVVFGAGSKVDVGSLTVSTADIDNDDFMAGRLDFNQAGQSDAAIINRGTITAKEAGLISLVAPEVENNGVIIAKLGKVQMAAADTFSLDLAGDGLIQVAVSDEDAKKLASNTGRITAEGGYVAITAGHARNIVDSVVENSGVIEAHSMTKVGGKIVLSADRGITKMSGTMNASGLTGGGSIKIGGDYQGSGEDGTANSARTLVSEDAVINASATETGNGGQTIIWADERTYFYGDIDASGIEQGGFAEVSGKQYLDFNGNVDLAGAKLGTLLLDPDDLDIVAGAANPADFADDQILFAENAGGTSTIGADTISGRLTANANVILQANNTIDVDAAITSTGAGDLTLETAAGGVITVNAAIDVNSGDLTLKADEIDILANLSGTGDVQLTSADINQEIEIGSTDASDLNLTATELAFLQDGWNSITIGASDHEALIAVNDVVSFSDHTYIRNNVATSGNKMIDVNAAITTIDNSDLYLYGRGNGSSVHTWDGVHVVGDLDVARDLYVNTGGNDSYYNPTQIDVGRDMYITSGANIDFTKTLNVAGNLSITHYTGSPTYGVRLFGGADWNIGGNLNINSTHATAGTLTAYSGSTVDVGGDVDILFGSYIYNGTLTAAGAGDINLIGKAGGTTTIGGTVDSGAGNLTIKADEIDISANLSGTGDIQLTSADVNQEIEIGSTDAADLNLTATELAFLQDGWNSITIGGSDHEGKIEVNENVSFSDHTYIRNDLSYDATVDKAIDINASITTSDSADLYLYGRANSLSTHGYDGVNVSANLNIARDLYVQSGSGASDAVINSSLTQVGRDFILRSGNNSAIYNDLIVGRDLDIIHSTNNSAYQMYLHAGTIDVAGNISIAQSNTGKLRQLANSILEADGNITITANDVNLDSSAQIRSGSGTSTLTFLETGENADMELGGTSQGASWQMETAEFDTIQDGFSSVVFGSSSYIGDLYITGALNAGTNDLIFKADEIDISANMSGTGDIQFTSADVNQEIEIGSTDAADLNLTATELGFLQDGWNSITIGASDHTSLIAVNEAVNFSDTAHIRNITGGVYEAEIDVNASITTTDNADLNLYGTASGFSPHGYDGVNIGADLNIARDLAIYSPSDQIGIHADVMVGQDMSISVNNALVINGNVTTGQDFTLNEVGTAYAQLRSGNTIDAAGDINISTSTPLVLYANSALEADGDITITSSAITIDSTASISGNVNGTSSLVFLESGENNAMELGGTSAGHTWNLSQAEIATIQDGFSSITFGSASFTEAIDITGAVSFSDNVNFYNTGDNSTIRVTGAFTTTDSANVVMESGSAANMGWDSVNIDADMNIAGDLTTRSGAGTGSGHVDVNNTNMIIGGDWLIDSDNSGYIVTTTLNVGGDLSGVLANNGQSLSKYIFSVGTATVGGDLSLYSHEALTLNGDFDVGGNVVLDNSAKSTGVIAFQSGTMDFAGSLDVVGSNRLDVSNAVLTADGNISFESSEINVTGVSSISGNTGGTSTLTFLENDEDEAMELGGTSAGHTWQMTATELASIQDGFSSITFGSTSFTEAIDITGAVSFSDNVNFYNTGDESTIHVAGAFSTTDSANVVMESGSAANVGWDAINIDADMNIAGDLTTRTGAGTGSGHVDVNNTNMIIGGDWLIDSDNDGYITTNTLNVGGDLTGILSDKSINTLYDINVTTATIGGDLSLTGHTNLILDGDFDVTGNVTLDNSARADQNIFLQNGTMNFGGTLDVRASNNINITSTTIGTQGNTTLNADRDADQDGAISFFSSSIDTNGGDFIAGGGTDPSINSAYGDYGIDLRSNSSIATGGGGITLNAVSNATIDNRHALRLLNSTISSGAGDITIYAANNSTGAANSNDSMIINDNTGPAYIQTTSGNISITAENTVNTASADGINIISDGYISSTTGNIAIESSVAGSGSALLLNNSGSNYIGGATTTGNITLALNSISMSSTDTIETTGDITISSLSSLPGTTIGLGGGSGDLNFTDDELAGLLAGGTLIIGDSTNGTGNVNIDSWDLSGTSYNVELYGGDFDLSGLTLGAGDITVSSISDINLNAAVGNNAQGGDVHFVAGNEFINNVGAAGINAGNGRYLVYAASPAQVTKNGLSASNLYQRTYALNPPSSLASSSDYFVFASVDPTPAPPQSSNAIPEDFTPSVEYQVAANNFDNLLPGLPVVPGLNISNRISSVNDTPIKLKKDVALNRFANSREIYADVRLLEAELLKVDEPIVREYDLCSHSDLYCR